MLRRLETVLTVILVVCAIASTGAFLHRSYASSPPRPSKSALYYPDWQRMATQGHLVHSAPAPVTLIEFGDYECPWCAAFERVLGTARARHASDLAVVYVHAINPSHRLSLPAARAAECSAKQAKFDQYHALLFAQQDSLGLKPWAAFAAEAGVPDVPSFETCARDTTAIPLVAEGRELARRVRLEGTPTIIINGWLLNWVPGEMELERLVQIVKDKPHLTKAELLAVVD